MHCVIGSGPAGVACAKALLARGATVLMLDAGIELEPDRARIVRKLAGEKPSAWNADRIRRAERRHGRRAPKAFRSSCCSARIFPIAKRRKKFRGAATAPACGRRSRSAA